MTDPDADLKNRMVLRIRYGRIPRVHLRIAARALGITVDGPETHGASEDAGRPWTEGRAVKITRIDLFRYDDDGEPSATGDLDITFHGEGGIIIASVTVKPNGWAHAHVVDDGQISVRATIHPGECDVESE